MCYMRISNFFNSININMSAGHLFNHFIFRETELTYTINAVIEVGRP